MWRQQLRQPYQSPQTTATPNQQPPQQQQQATRPGFLFFFCCRLQDLGDVDPDLLQGFEKLRDYDGGDDEDVFGIDFRVGGGAQVVLLLHIGFSITYLKLYLEMEKKPELRVRKWCAARACIAARAYVLWRVAVTMIRRVRFACNGRGFATLVTTLYNITLPVSFIQSRLSNAWYSRFPSLGF